MEKKNPKEIGTSEIDPKMLENLDMLLQLDVLEEEENWDDIEDMESWDNSKEASDES